VEYAAKGKIPVKKPTMATTLSRKHPLENL
jgi:hypothetical protein